MSEVSSFVWRLLFLMFGIMGVISCAAPLFHAIMESYRWAFRKMFRRVKVAFLNKEKK